MLSETEASTGEAPLTYGRKVGERLRAIRRQKRLSLQDVEAGSSQEFKASVLGAYERGERAISVPRLQRLARFYSVPVDQLLPRDEGPDFGDGAPPDTTGRGTSGPASSVTIDLTRLESLSGPEADMLSRYLTMIQVQRQDFNGRVLTIRRDDLRALACILGTGVDGAAYDADAGAYAPYRTGFSERLPTYHRLDVRMDKQFRIGPLRGSVFVDIQNVYSAPSQEGVLYQYDFRQTSPLPGIPILPSVGVRFFFEPGITDASPSEDADERAPAPVDDAALLRRLPTPPRPEASP